MKTKYFKESLTGYKDIIFREDERGLYSMVLPDKQWNKHFDFMTYQQRKDIVRNITKSKELSDEEAFLILL